MRNYKFDSSTSGSDKSHLSLMHLIHWFSIPDTYLYTPIVKRTKRDLNFALRTELLSNIVRPLSRMMPDWNLSVNTLHEEFAETDD